MRPINTVVKRKVTVTS